MNGDLYTHHPPCWTALSHVCVCECVNVCECGWAQYLTIHHPPCWTALSCRWRTLVHRYILAHSIWTNKWDCSDGRVVTCTNEANSCMCVYTKILDPPLNIMETKLWSKTITKECSSETDTSKSDNPQQHLNALDDLNPCACSHITSYLSKHDKQNFEFMDLDTDKDIELSYWSQNMGGNLSTV